VAPTKAIEDFPEAPFQDLDEDEEKEEILLQQFASKMSIKVPLAAA
jgi:hypothetical protein